MRLNVLGFSGNELGHFSKLMANLQRALGGLSTRLLKLQALNFKRVNPPLNADNRAALLRCEHA